jgi:hypothetical protein
MVAQSPDRKWRRRRCLLALTLIAAVTLTMEITPHRSAHGLAGKRSESEPAFEVLSSDFWRILDRVRTSWKGGRPFGTARSKAPLAEADR